MSNVILITLDAVRPDHLGCYGYSPARTPNIDQLAGTSFIFNQAFTNGSYTKTAFPPLLSSTYAGMYGGPFAEIDNERPMLSRILQSKGYNTAGFTANPLLGAHVGYDAGFDVFKEPVPLPDSRSWLNIKGAQTFLRSPAANALLMRLGADTAPHPVYVRGDIVTDLACNWLEQQTGNFFLWIHYMDAHWPYHIPSSLTNGKERARAWQDLHLGWKYRKTHPGDGVVERLIALYDTAIAQLDGYIGQILKTLDANNLIENSAILLSADHGEAFYEHNHFQHGAYYDFHEEILHIPLILHLPGGAQQSRIDTPVCLLDVVPTILDFLEIPVDPVMEGRSLLELLSGKPFDTSASFIIEMLDLNLYCACIRTQNYKYLYDERRPNQRELYNIIQDPGEHHDIFGNNPQVESILESVLQQHLKRVIQTHPRDATGNWKKDDDVERRLKALGYVD